MISSNNNNNNNNYNNNYHNNNNNVIDSNNNTSMNNNNNNNNNNDDEYEEILLSISFPEILPNNNDENMLLSKSIINIKDINTSTPSCNIDGYQFRGKYQYSLGTMAYFKKDDNDSTSLIGIGDKILQFDMTEIPSLKRKNK
jgi:hypothetical protein